MRGGVGKEAGTAPARADRRFPTPFRGPSQMW